METIVETGPEWDILRGQVEAACRKSELRVVEDQVDAVLCAYVARMSDLEPARLTTYGDMGTGYIVTPTLPADLPDDPVRRAVQEYAAQQPALIEAGEQAIALVTSILDEAGINYLSVTGRTKSVPSFAEKAARTLDGEPLYPEPLRDITDQIGVRIITYVHSDVAAVAELLGDQVVVHDDRDLGEETASEGRFGYASRHLLIGLDQGRRASVQIRTVLQHAWAEFEHDIRYKGTVPAEHAPDFDRRFTLAAGLLELADREFSSIREALRPHAPGPGRAERRPAAGPARAGGVPRRAVRRRGLVAHRPLRLDLRAAARARHRLPRRAERGAARRPTTWRSTSGWTTATRPAPSAASTTRCSQRSASATWRCTATSTGCRC